MHRNRMNKSLHKKSTLGGGLRARPNEHDRSNDFVNLLLSAGYDREFLDPHHRRWVPLADQDFLFRRVEAHGDVEGAFRRGPRTKQPK